MAFNFGAGDIIAGVRIASTIYEYGFVEENAADVRYRTFQNDVLNFRQLLERLEESLQQAQRRYVDATTHAVATIGAIEPLSRDFERERTIIIGNFIATLKECNALLEENRQFRQRYSNVLENLRWHLSQQEQRVDDLRRRLHFHAEKIRLVIDRLSINLLSNLDDRVGDLLELAQLNIHLSNGILLELNRFRSTLFGYLAGHGPLDEPHTEDTHVASFKVAQKFKQGLAINPPPGVESGIPLVEGFDALFLCFVQGVEDSDQTPEKYLLFLKARWLLAHIKDSPAFGAARPGYYYKRAVNQIEQAILARIRRPGEIVGYDDATLITLPESSFLIWPPPPPAPATRPSQPHPLSERANEEQVVRLQLASLDNRESDVVTIFQHSQEHFRIVLETRSAENERIIIQQAIYTPEDSLVPRYALPPPHDRCLEIAIFSRRFSEEIMYRFKSEQDVWNFQKALTGYDVSHDQGGINCQFGDRAAFLDCYGRIQLWQDPILFPGTEQTGSPHETTLRSPSSTSDGSHRHSLVPSTAPTNTIHRTHDGWEVDSIKLPAMIIFTQLTDKRFAIIFIELIAGIEISPTECSCHEDYNKCSKLVLVRRDKPRFPVRFLLPPLDAHGNPNPNTCDLLPFRITRQPDYGLIQTEQSGYVMLKFACLKEKQRFHRGLIERFKVRDKQIKDQEGFIEAMRMRQDRPIRSDSTRMSPLQHSLSSVRRVQTLPPQIEVPDSGPTLAESFAHGTDLRPIQNQRNGSRSTSMSTSPRTNGSYSTSFSNRTSHTDPTDFGSTSPTTSAGTPTAIFPRNQPRSPGSHTHGRSPEYNAAPRANPPAHDNNRQSGNVANGSSVPNGYPSNTSRQNTTSRLPSTASTMGLFDSSNPQPQNMRTRTNTNSTMQPEVPIARRRDSTGGRLKGFRNIVRQF